MFEQVDMDERIEHLIYIYYNAHNCTYTHLSIPFFHSIHFHIQGTVQKYIRLLKQTYSKLHCVTFTIKCNYIWPPFFHSFSVCFLYSFLFSHSLSFFPSYLSLSSRSHSLSPSFPPSLCLLRGAGRCCRTATWAWTSWTS